MAKVIRKTRFWMVLHSFLSPRLKEKMGWQTIKYLKKAIPTGTSLGRKKTSHNKSFMQHRRPCKIQCTFY